VSPSALIRCSSHVFLSWRSSSFIRALCGFPSTSKITHRHGRVVSSSLQNEIYYTCPYVFCILFLRASLRLFFMWEKGLESSGNCKLLGWTLNDRLSPSHRTCRYSNTLFVTFNNRIYFRDHLSPGGLVSQPEAIPVQTQPLPSATISHGSVSIDLLRPTLSLDPEKCINDAL
jgi:hypothetical protein